MTAYPVSRIALLVLLVVLASAGRGLAQSVNLNIGTLPPGKSVSVTFKVEITTPLPDGVCEIANQGVVSGTNFANVLTDDPDVGGASDPTVTVLTAPGASATGGAITCENASVNLQASSTYGALYSWSGPNGFTSSAQNPAVATSGTYTVSVTASGGGCINTAQAVVTENATPVVAGATGGTLTCAAPTLQLLSSPAGLTYAWSGPGGFSSTEQNPTVGTGGTFYVSVVNTDNGCSSTAQAAVVENFSPPGASATGGAITCLSSTVPLGSATTTGTNYSWTGPGGFTSTTASPTVGTSGTYVLTVTNTGNSCTSTAEALVTLNTTPPGASTTGGTLSCSVTTVTLGSATTGGTGFSWSGPGGFTSTMQNPVVGTSGTYTVIVTNSTNGCTSSATATVDGDYVAPTLSVSSGPTSQSVQYSDTISSVTILATDNGPGTDLVAATSWKKDAGLFTSTPPLPSALTLSLASTGSTSRSWRLSGNARVATGVYTIRVGVTDGLGCSSQTDVIVTVTQEDAVATFTGPLFVSTSSASSKNATLTLGATVQDISALAANADYDNQPGDIRHATMNFHSDAPYGFDETAPLGLVNPLPDTLNAIGVTTKAITLSTTDFNSGGTALTVIAQIGGRYTNTNALDDATAIICVSVPSNDNISGGGYLVMSSSSSAGLYRGKPGSKSHFAWTMKFNKSGKNVQGQATVMVRAYDDKRYLFKSNSINSMSVNSNRAVLSTKANITDITGPGAPVSVGGNFTMIIDMLDSNKVGQTDSVAITVLDNNGGLIYASEWNGIRTTMRGLRVPSGAGNVNIKNGSLSKEGDDEIPVEYALFQNYPNPFNPSTTIQFDLPEPSNVRVVVYDLLGRVVAELANGGYDAGRHRMLWAGQDHQGHNVASGVYLFKIDAASMASQRSLHTVKKMLLMK